MLKSVPNILTLLRIAMIPVFIVVFYLPFKGNHWVAAGIFAAASFTDWLDGYLARKLKQTSRLGAFLDPVADKLLVATALVMIVGINYYHYLVVPAVVIIGREIVISALREWMAEIGERTSVAVINIAKWKTLIQMVAIVLLVAYTPRDSYIIVVLGYITLYLAMLLTLWTMCIYLYAARKAFRSGE